MYKQIINENKRVEKTDLYDKSLITSLTVDTTILELKNLEINKTTTAKFSLKNIGPNPLVVNNVTTTCGCTVPNWSKQPVLPNKTTDIVVQVTPNKEGYFKKNVTIYCNIERRYVKLVIQGKVNNQSK